jgi:hypothetical protein
MAKPQKDRDADTARRRAEAGEVELRHRVRPGILAMLRDLMTWGGFAQMVECLQTLYINAHALGPDGARRLLEVPRHDFTPSENVAQQLYRQGQREADRLDRLEDVQRASSSE